jgi:uncharacterized protein YjcR
VAKRQRRKTNAQREKIIRLYQEDVEINEIARKVGCSRSTVQVVSREWRERTGYPSRAKVFGLTEDQIRERAAAVRAKSLGRKRASTPPGPAAAQQTPRELERVEMLAGLDNYFGFAYFKL